MLPEAVRNPTISALLAELLAQAEGKGRRIMAGPGEADRIAEEHFPDDARDASRKNAFRHALGTGMLTQELGGGPLAAMAAKLAGYGWEGLGLPHADGEDMRHDLNANAIGAAEATIAPDRAALIEALLKHAAAAERTSPPGVFERSPGRFTYSKE